ncbi:MAG: DUF4924 family protein [Bacteroidales bacterium]|nr:DUF4924 family protein [Bacteroidales bacterium]
MIIAHKKKKENIAEYLLYMWQIEDLIRANNLELDRIQAVIIDKFEQPEEVKKEIRDWYESLIDMMRREDKQESGHLQLNQNVIIDLTDLHLRLIQSGKEPFYVSTYYKTLPYIVELRAKSGDDKKGEIETCFSALYGILMLRLKGQTVSEETMNAIKQISVFLGMLNDKHIQDINSELNPE